MRSSSAIISCLVLSILITSITAQDKRRYIEVEKLDGSIPAPLEIVEIRIGEKKLSGDSLLADSNWLKDLRITVRNISDKTVTRVLLMALVSGEGSTYWKFRTQFQQYGESPFQKVRASKPKLPSALKPDEAAVIRIDPKMVDVLMQQFAKHDIYGTDRIVIEYAQIIFDDNSGYARGRKICHVPGKPGANNSVPSGTICPTN
jgi:hypothetical protein